MLRFELRSGCYLRLFEESDAEELDRVIAANRAYLAKWLAWADETGGAEAWLEFIRRTREKVAGNDGFCAAIIDGDAIVGWVGFDSVDWDSRSTSIGYWLARDWQGRGIMTEAVAALTGYAFEVWKLNRVAIHVAVGNERSVAIPQRLGFREEGILRQRERHGDSFRDIVVYSMLAQEWDGSAATTASRRREANRAAVGPMGDFVPRDFDAPRRLETPQFLLEPLGPEHNEQDYDAWTSSMEHIAATPGWGESRWPREMTPDENRADLQRHADDFRERRGFTYTVLDPANRAVVGCVYIYPAKDGDADARVMSWVRASHAALDVPLWRAVSDWLASDWPFGSVDYAARPSR